MPLCPETEIEVSAERQIQRHVGRRGGQCRDVFRHGHMCRPLHWTASLQPETGRRGKPCPYIHMPCGRMTTLWKTVLISPFPSPFCNLKLSSFHCNRNRSMSSQTPPWSFFFCINAASDLLFGKMQKKRILRYVVSRHPSQANTEWKEILLRTASLHHLNMYTQ